MNDRRTVTQKHVSEAPQPGKQSRTYQSKGKHRNPLQLRDLRSMRPQAASPRTKLHQVEHTRCRHCIAAAPSDVHPPAARQTGGVTYAPARTRCTEANAGCHVDEPHPGCRLVHGDHQQSSGLAVTSHPYPPNRR